MPELELTPVEDGQPPHVDIRVDADDEYLLRSVRIYRDGEEIRARIPDRIPRIRVSDFEAPYDTEIDYVVEGQQIPDEEPLIDEQWDDFDDWEGDTGDWRLPSGDTSSPVAVNLVTDPSMGSWVQEFPDMTVEQRQYGVSITATDDIPSETDLFSAVVPVDEDDTAYRFSGWLFSTYQGPGDWVLSWRVDWLDDEDNVLDSMFAFDPGVVVKTATVVGDAPAGTVAARIVAYSGWNAPSGTVYTFQRPILTHGFPIVTFFTGDFDDTARWRYEWEGDVNGSRSRKYDMDRQPVISTTTGGSTLRWESPDPFNQVMVEAPTNVRVRLIEEIEDDDEGSSASEHTVAEVITGIDTTRVIGETSSSTSNTGSYTAYIDDDNQLAVSGDNWDVFVNVSGAPTIVEIVAEPDSYLHVRDLDPGFELQEHDRIAATDRSVFIARRDEGRLYKVNVDDGTVDSWAAGVRPIGVDVEREYERVWVLDVGEIGENMIPNLDLESGWGETPITDGPGSEPGRGSETDMWEIVDVGGRQAWRGTHDGDGSTEIFSRPWDVTPGQRLYTRFTVRGNWRNGSGNARMWLYALNSQDEAIESWTPFVTTQNLGDGRAHTLEAWPVVPAGATRMCIRFYINTNATEVTFSDFVIADAAEQQLLGYQLDGTLEYTIDLLDPGNGDDVARYNDDTVFGVARGGGGNPMGFIVTEVRDDPVWTKDGYAGWFIDSTGRTRNLLGTRSLAQGQQRSISGPSGERTDWWAAIPDAGVVRKYSMGRSGWDLGNRTNWNSQAIDIDNAPDGDVDSGFQKFELWTDHVREVQGVGRYTGNRWDLTIPAWWVVTNHAGDYFVTANQDGSMSVYGPLAEIGRITVTAVEAQEGEEFTLTGTVSLFVDDAWLIHPENPERLSIRLPDEDCRITPCDPSGLSVDPSTDSERVWEAKRSTFTPPNSRRAIVNTFGNRPDPEFELVLNTHSIEDRDRVIASQREQRRMLLRMPTGYRWDLPDGWYSIGDITQNRLAKSDLTRPYRSLTLPMLPARAPSAVTTVRAWTYDAAWRFFDTLDNLERSGITWLQLLEGDVD